MTMDKASVAALVGASAFLASCARAQIQDPQPTVTTIVLDFPFTTITLLSTLTDENGGGAFPTDPISIESSSTQSISLSSQPTSISSSFAPSSSTSAPASPSSTQTPVSAPSDPQQPVSTLSSNTSAIAGGVVGGVVGLAVLGSLLFLFLRRRRRTHSGRSAFFPGSGGGGEKGSWVPKRLGSDDGHGAGDKKKKAAVKKGGKLSISAPVATVHSTNPAVHVSSPSPGPVVELDDDGVVIDVTRAAAAPASPSSPTTLPRSPSRVVYGHGQPRSTHEQQQQHYSNHRWSHSRAGSRASNGSHPYSHRSLGGESDLNPFAGGESPSDHGHSYMRVVEGEMSSPGGASGVSRAASAASAHRLARKAVPRYDPPAAASGSGEAARGSMEMRELSANANAGAVAGDGSASASSSSHREQPSPASLAGPGHFRFAGEREGPVHVLIPDPPSSFSQ